MLKQKIAGSIAGLFLGDSMGMPGELWPKEVIKNKLGTIKNLIDGHPENEVSYYYKAGEFTDDSAQALIFLNLLAEYKTIPDVKIIANKLLEWAKQEDAFNKNILGSSSKASLLAHKTGDDYKKITQKAESNGAAMRIAPVGMILYDYSPAQLAQVVFDISKVTHSTDVTIAGACMIAQAVASAIMGKNFQQILTDVYEIHDIGYKLGYPTYSANCKERLKLAIKLIDESDGKENTIMNILYNIIGSGLMTSESVPTAIALAYYSKTPEYTAYLAANLGGDTDTIGAMATAITGAYKGIDSISNSLISKLEYANKVSINSLAEKIIDTHNFFHLK